jgi:hypothetical protein
MKPRKPKSEPSVRDKLAQGFVEAFQADFEENGKAVIEALRNKSPDKYTEIAARLIAATEPQSQTDGIAGANSSEDIGRRLLQSIGVAEPTDEQVEEAIMANNRFVEQLEGIKERAAFLAEGGELN